MSTAASIRMCVCLFVVFLSCARVQAEDWSGFRGVAPAGETVDSLFHGNSNLIHGPNGSGKTSLLGAVTWVLTGEAVSDAHEMSDTAPVYKVPTADGKGRTIVDWPVVATLPDGQITKNSAQDCSVCIELLSVDKGTTLHLRRTIASGLEFSVDGNIWEPCEDLFLLPRRLQAKSFSTRRRNNCATFWEKQLSESASVWFGGKRKLYAEGEVLSVFSDIREHTIANWRTLYPERASGLAPARLVVGTGRDKSVTALLSKAEYEVPEQFFGNAGLQRTVALSFYFALLVKHPGGLGFVIMDDPILSRVTAKQNSWTCSETIGSPAY